MSHYDHLSVEEKVAKLNELIDMWREPEMATILPRVVIPDTTNRENTGLSPNHVHYLADKMQRNGFVPRNNVTGTGHDLPILVRETAESAYGSQSLEKWSQAVERKPDLPRTPLGLGQHQGEFFCSLGNGHFFQALNLFGTKHECKFPQSTGHKRYWTLFDNKLHSAVNEGIPSIVLGNGIPLLDRKFISIMLNSTFEFRWVLVDPSSKGSSQVRLDNSETFREFSTLDGLTKHADAFELDEIIDQKMQFEERDKKRARL
ncbi:hypothetical protein BASA81_008267 [Batrachochytrium salamandrivorans]|nr:hypothetical protein BASA81_008267 [Batrachochytrium salamandrivorans]